MSCPTGKVMHLRREYAKAAIAKVYAGGGKGRLRAFRCDLCGFFHVGHAIIQSRKGSAKIAERTI